MSEAKNLRWLLLRIRDVALNCDVERLSAGNSATTLSRSFHWRYWPKAHPSQPVRGSGFNRGRRLDRPSKLH